MSKHTPGPWTTKIIDTINGEPAYWHIVQQSTKGVVGDVQTANFADARLIAAAPRMSAALKRAAHLLAEIDQSTAPAILSLRAEIVACIKDGTPEYYGATIDKATKGEA